MNDWRWYLMFGVGSVWEFISHWFHIFMWAHVCIWELATGQEQSCPPCWKCSLARAILVAAYAGIFSYLLVCAM